MDRRAVVRAGVAGATTSALTSLGWVQSKAPLVLVRCAN